MFLYTCFGSEQTDQEQTEMINTVLSLRDERQTEAEPGERSPDEL